MARVAAVIPHWNRRDLLLNILESLRGQTRAFDQIIVVDNGSTDDSAETAGDAGATVLRLETNQGFAVAVNRGVQKAIDAGADWIAILNNDVTLASDWLEGLLESAEKHSAWFATGKILSAQNPALVDGTFDELARSGCAWRCGAGNRDGPPWNTLRRIRMAPMTAALFRAELFKEIGLLEERFGSYLEDVDFGLRAALAGLSGVYEPRVIAHHRGSSTLGKWNKDTVFLISRNQVLLVRKYYVGQSLIPVLVGQLLWVLLAARHGRGWAALVGKLAGIRSPQHFHSEKSRFKSKYKLGEVLEEGEKTICELGSQAGLDRYWRAYFCLSRR